MSLYIQYGKQLIEEDDIRAVIEALQSDFLTTGPKVKEFEACLCAETGAPYAAALANGTAALHAACFAAGIEKGDEVITTPMTFAASANAVLYCGAVPVFADIDANTYNLDPVAVEKKITKKTKAIIAVDFTGQPCDMDALGAIARKHNLILIQDAAHSLGAKYQNKPVGSLADLTTFSFHPVKPITTGEGGAVVCADGGCYEKLLLFRNHGITRDPGRWESGGKESQGGWYYEQQELGFNCRLSDIHAALGVSQLKKLAGFLKRRKEIVKQYNEAFKDLGKITVPFLADGCDSAWHLYVVKLDKSLDRKEIYERFQENGIGVNVHYIPVYWHPYYQKLGYKKGICPVAEALYHSILTLPLHQGMSDADVVRVIEVTRAFCA